MIAPVLARIAEMDCVAGVWVDHDGRLVRLHVADATSPRGCIDAVISLIQRQNLWAERLPDPQRQESLRRVDRWYAPSEAAELYAEELDRTRPPSTD